MLRKLFVMVAVLAALTVALAAAPAGAIVHEITGMQCSGGHAQESPPGIADEEAANFIRPLIASGAITASPFMGGVLFAFDESKPQVKVTNVGDPFPIGPGLWLQPFEFTGKPFDVCHNG